MAAPQTIQQDYRFLQSPQNLRGGYGFLTDFGEMDLPTARDRIDRMFNLYRIREFHFYDWFASYSSATLPGGLWQNAWSHQYNIYEYTIKAYIDEIHRLGGRAWAYVQSVGAEEYDLANESSGIFKLLDSQGRWIKQTMDAPRFPCYFRNAALADHQCEVWLPSLKQLGFDGVHWDTLGADAGDYEAEVAGTHEFLRQAKKHLSGFGLDQILNFSGPNPTSTGVAWWDPALVADGTIAFPYFEVYSMADEQRVYDAMSAPSLVTANPFPVWAAMAFYPRYNIPDGFTESDTFLARWAYAPKNRVEYVGVGDGECRLHDQYMPINYPLTSYEKEVLILDPPFAVPPKMSWQT